METSALTATGFSSDANLSSNNPYRQRAASQNGEEAQQIAKEQQQSLDSEKQVVSIEAQSGPSNAPIPVETEDSGSKPEPEREAGKEVVSSWQSQSREENAPISMEYHESRTSQGDLLNDIKGPPPSYDTQSQKRTVSDDMLTTPTSIEPDSPSYNIPPRPEDRSAVGQLLSWIPSAQRIRTEQMPPFIQPIVIPQLEVPPQGESVPFARCYSDVLASHDISMRDFTQFLDGLALAQAPNSALQGLKVFGAGVSSLPIPIIGLAGKGISALATSGSGHSGSRARLYLERAKKEYFAPRGLRLSIVKDGDLNPRLQIPSHASRLAPLMKNTLTSTSCDRRLEAVAPYVAPLRYDVPEQDQQTQGVHKLARKHLEHRFKVEGKKFTKNREVQWRDVSHLGLENSGWDQQYAEMMSEIRRLQQDLLREQRSKGVEERVAGGLTEWIQELEQKQRRLQLLVSERQMTMQNAANHGRGVEAEMEEVNWSRRLKWIVIENLQ